VAENLRTTVECKLIGEGEAYNGGTEVIGLELNILGKELSFHIDVGHGQARLADIVPLARTLSTEITNAVVESIHSDGGNIPCCKGCATCCGPYLVPLSVPEVLRLKEEISAAPQHQRQSMFRACLLSAKRILSQKPPTSLMSQTTESSRFSSAELELVSNWYADLKLTCPFLYNNVCTIYKQRPLACREHFVKGSADACVDEHSTAKVVEIPVQVTNALAELASELEGTSVEAVILPLVFPWCEENAGRAERTWPAVMMVKRFFEIVRKMASKNSTAVVV
jgi:Fe-S-cluster containining protein